MPSGHLAKTWLFTVLTEPWPVTFSRNTKINLREQGFCHDRTCYELRRVLQGQARSGFGDPGANYFRHFYGRPRATAHPALLRGADRLTARSRSGGCQLRRVQMLAFIYVFTIWCLANNIVCERRLARNKPPPRPSAQAPDPRYKRCGNRETTDVIAASSVAIGHAAMDAAIANYPNQRFTLRNGILVIRQHPPG